MNSKKLIYCACSQFSAREANVIQSKHMISQFRKLNFSVYEIWKKRPRDFAQTSDGLRLITCGSSKFSHWLFLIRCTCLARNIARFDKNAVFFTRNIGIAFLLTTFRKNPIVLELHNEPRSFLENSLYKFICERVCLVFISHALKDFYLTQNKNINFIVQHDGHSNEIVEREELSEYLQSWSNDREIKIGYFGRFSKQKGSVLLTELINLMPYAKFSIATLNTNNLAAPNIVENERLEHNEVFKKIKQMDFLLLPIINIDSREDISKYTSPLKLFEYAASGKVIIASDQPVLREFSQYKALVLSENKAASFKNNIDQLIIDSRKRSEISDQLLYLARDFTWENRAKSIVTWLNI